MLPHCSLHAWGTTHRNIHQLLAFYRRLDGKVPWSIRRRYHPAERALALRGYTASRPNPEVTA